MGRLAPQQLRTSLVALCRPAKARTWHPVHLVLPGIPIQIEFSQPYADGGRVAWGSLVSSVDFRASFKVDVNTGQLIDVYRTDERETNPPMSEVD